VKVLEEYLLDSIRILTTVISGERQHPKRERRARAPSKRKSIRCTTPTATLSGGRREKLGLKRWKGPKRPH